MDTRPQELDPTRLKAGAELLRLTDSVGFDARSAAWILDRETGVWRYVLSSPMVAARGPDWVYARLLRAFERLPFPEGMSPLDVFVIEPAVEEAVLGGQDALGAAGTLPGVEATAAIRSADLGPFSVGLGLAFFYRRCPHGERGRDPSRIFDLRVRKLAA